jgi:acetyl esterase/lipase
VSTTDGPLSGLHGDAAAARDDLPVPSGLSEQAQQFLRGSGTYALARFPADLSDVGAWQRFISERQREIADRVAQALPQGLDQLPIERTDLDIAGVRTFELRPQRVSAAPTTPLYLDLHGGGLILGGGDVCAAVATVTALGRRAVTWAVDYRMPPLHPYPAALDDCLAAYRHALSVRPPENIVVGGLSAGGNLAAALLLRAKDEGLPMPAALVLLSPEVDLTESGDTFTTLLGVDPVLRSLEPVNRLYAAGHDLSHPYLSPLFGDLAGLPPTLLQSGTRDLFLSNTVRMHRALRRAGVQADLHVWDAMPHGGFGGAPEDAEVLKEVQRFIDQHVGSP